MEFLVLLMLAKIILFLLPVTGASLDNCPPADPNCHPTCIVYTSDHCRYCMCDKGLARGTSSNSGAGFDSGLGMSTDAAWDRGIEGGDWSSKMSSDSSVWSNSGGGFGSSSSEYSPGAKKETVKYVIVEKEPEPSYFNSPQGSGINPLSTLSNPFPAGMSSPFSGSHMPTALLPGSNSIKDSHSYGENVIHVPLLAPGIPKYCVKCHILSCPGTCERVDEYGCRSCPCAPSRYQTMPVVKDCSNQQQVVLEPDCSATKLCIESCSEGYQLGDVGRDGCRSCACVRRATTTPKPEVNGCLATLSCMLKCKDGYLLGDKQANGCPSCRCLSNGLSTNVQHSSSKTSSSTYNNNNNNNNNNNKNNNNWNGGNWNSNNGQTMNSGSGTGSGGKGNGCSDTKANYLTSVNGIGSGKCEPPMCIDGHMSVDEAMKIGAHSAGGGGGCNEGNGGSGVMDGGSIAGGSNSFTMNGGGFGSGIKGGGMGMGSMGMGSGGSSASGQGVSSPFSVSMSGAGAGGGGGMSMGGGGGGGMTMGGGGGGSRGGGGSSGMPFSPFSSAMSGGGPGKGMSPGMGGGMSGIGSAMGTENAVSSVAYNKDCVGAECSTKNRMQHKDCPDLIHCLVTCDGSYKLGQLDDAGCQTCSCTK